MTVQTDDAIVDRRRDERVPCALGAKVYLPTSVRFASAQTANVSRGGALVRIERDRPIRAGERVQVAIVKPESLSAIVEAKTMRPARVVRVTPIDHFHQAVALAFEDVEELAKAA